MWNGCTPFYPFLPRFYVMPLTLIGTGIAFDLTLSAIEELKSCERVYWEGYTGLLTPGQIASLSERIAKPCIELQREQVESSFLLNEARKARIVLLVGGDPLTATTHIALLLEAQKANIVARVIPNSSIYPVAAGKAGLQIYRFGKTVSLVNPRPNYQPTSPFEGIRQNLASNLHTLILLDTEPHAMEAKSALEMLEKAGFANEKIVALSRLGFVNERITYGQIPKLKTQNLGNPPFCLILPAKLHPLEEEYLFLFHI